MAENQPIISPSEEWRPVPGWEGFYEVSNHGRVKSLDREVITKVGYRRLIEGRILKPTVKPTGYLFVRLSRGNVASPEYIHHLVLNAFRGPRPEGFHGCHFDDDKNNNHVENLRWDTVSANKYDLVRNGKHHLASRENCPRGHRLADLNLVDSHKKYGHRTCLACSRARAHVRRHPHLREKLQSVSDSYYESIS